MKGGKCCRSLYLRVAWIPCVNGWYVCWQQQQPLSQLELAWELLLNVQQSQEKKKEYFFHRFLTMPVTVAVVVVVVGVLRKENNSLSIVNR